MANTSKNKKNLPPTGEGKKQSRYSGKAYELNKRSEVLQAERNHPEQNIGSQDEEMALRGESESESNNPRRQKAGR